MILFKIKLNQLKSGMVEEQMRQEGVFNYTNTELELSPNTTIQHLIYRIKNSVDTHKDKSETDTSAHI